MTGIRWSAIEKIEAYNFPQWVLSQLYQAVAAKKPGLITKTGLQTFIDPCIEGEKNKRAAKDLVRLLEIDGAKWLFYPSMKYDFGLIRGTTADADIRVLQSLDGKHIQRWVRTGHADFSRLQQIRVPVIVKVESYALGDGLELALWCEVILATEDEPEASLGFQRECYLLSSYEFGID